MSSKIPSWIDGLSKKLAPVPDVVPQGWVSVTDFAKLTKNSESHSRNILIKAFKMGILERKYFKIDTTRGAYPVFHYREK